jgi:hypothetical protein
MASALEQIRKQYPQYANRSDRELADALYSKFYADKMDKPSYYAKLGMTTEDRESYGPLDIINNVVNQVGTGAYKGIAGLVGLPGAISEIGVAMDAPRRYGGIGGTPNPDAPTENRNPWPTPHELLGMLETGTAAGADYLGLPGLRFQQAPAETTTDKLLQAGGAGATAVFMPGSALPNFTGGVVGGEASELAGMATEGTKFEPVARLLGGVLGGAAGVSGVNRVAASSIEDLLSRATAGYSKADFAKAAQLQADAAARGTPITAAEALAQLKGGNRQLMSAQRYAEQASDSERQMGGFLAQRATANQAATEQQLGRLAQRPDAPFEVGPRVQRSAQQSIEGVRQQINKLTEDAYRWGTDALIPPAEFAPIAESPVFQQYAAKVRADPLLGAAVKDLDENSIAFVNQVKKAMDEDAANYSTYGTGQTSPERAMRLDQAQGPMVEAARRASPLYEQALEQQAMMRRTQLEPMQRGATGQLAETDDWQRQAQIFMSDAPGSEKEVAQAVRNIMKSNPESGANDVAVLIRMRLEDVWNKAAPNVKGAGEEFRGANFASILEKNPQAMKSMEAAIRALPNGDVQWQGFRNLLKVYEAQGFRLPAGSPTEFNRMMTEGFQRSRFGDLKSFGVDMLQRFNVRRRTGELARVLTHPEGVVLLEQLAKLGPNSARAAQLVQAFFQSEQNTLGKQEPVIDIFRTLGLPSPERAGAY